MRARWYYLALVALALGGTGMLYYRSHIEKTPLTGRERFIAVTREQFMKIANAEAIGVRLLFSFFFKATIYSFQFPQSVYFFNTITLLFIAS